MAIGKGEVFQVADKLYAKGVKVTNKSVKQALKETYKSGGNSNEVCDDIGGWFEERGIERKPSAAANRRQKKTTTTKPAATLEKPKPAEANAASILDRLPESLKSPLMVLVTAICTLIGIVRKQERDAAADLVDNATLMLQEELDQKNLQIAALKNENKRLSDENAALNAELAVKHDTVSGDKLLTGLMQLLGDYSGPGISAKGQQGADIDTKSATVAVKKPRSVKKIKEP